MDIVRPRCLVASSSIVSDDVTVARSIPVEDGYRFSQGTIVSAIPLSDQAKGFLSEQPACRVLLVSGKLKFDGCHAQEDGPGLQKDDVYSWIRPRIPLRSVWSLMSNAHETKVLLELMG